MTTLVIIEHDGERVKSISGSAISAAIRLGTEFRLLVIGNQAAKGIADSVRQYGASGVLIAEHAALEHPLADRYAAVIAHVASVTAATTVVGASSTFSKDILPRTAALIDAPMISDVMEIHDREGSREFVRPIYAGSALARVKTAGERLVLTCRPASFPAAPQTAEESPVEYIDLPPELLSTGTEVISRQQQTSNRPDLAEARVVVSGGRPLKDKATFELLIGGLADALGGAVGATRAAVDAGIAPNDWQIGQTGKVVRPELYIAAGISGSVQHSAGIQDSRVIVAINKDPEAPIFGIATYGIVGDLYDIIPRLIGAAQRDTTAGS